MKDDCPEKLKLAKIEIEKLKSYNLACEEMLQEIEFKIDQEINKKTRLIKKWKLLDPKADTLGMQSYIILLTQFREELFK